MRPTDSLTPLRGLRFYQTRCVTLGFPVLILWGEVAPVAMSLFPHNGKGTWVVYVLRGQNSKGKCVVYLGMTRRGSLRHSPRVPGSTEWVPFPAPGGPSPRKIKRNEKKRKRRKK